MDEMQEEAARRQEMARGDEARVLLEHPMLVEAFSQIRERYLTEWAESPARDTDGREKIWLMLKVLDAVKGHLTEVLTTGKLASIQLEQRRTAKQRVQEWMKDTMNW